MMSNRVPKEPAGKGDLTTRLLTSIGDLLASGELRPGERIPPERELAERFGASRSSLRPAMKVLESVGVIEQRVGDGSYLSADASGILAMPLTFLILLDGVSLIELFDARLMIEPELAARAAECASSEDLAAMRRTFGMMETNTPQADVDFHEAVCKATRNRICYRIFGAIHRAFEQGMDITSRLAPPGRALEFHRAVYSAIHLRQPDKARRRMAEHLNDAKAVMLQACLEGELPPIGARKQKTSARVKPPRLARLKKS
jgi:GntR family transcriptional regulator, transcriptional repressor for pyruvate dehydrogenase complex